jgi:hypothetical protein
LTNENRNRLRLLRRRSMFATHSNAISRLVTVIEWPAGGTRCVTVAPELVNRSASRNPSFGDLWLSFPPPMPPGQLTWTNGFRPLAGQAKWMGLERTGQLESSIEDYTIGRELWSVGCLTNVEVLDDAQRRVEGRGR